MIDAESNSKWREVMKMSGEWPGFGGLPLPEMFDTIKALWKENAELKDKLKRIEEFGLPPLSVFHKLEAVAKAAEAFKSESENPVPDLMLKARHRKEMYAALAALREGKP